jgi:hypothetical protein
MGNIASPRRYDAGTHHTPEPENTRPMRIVIALLLRSAS